jgi:hypothetical protein
LVVMLQEEKTSKPATSNKVDLFIRS